MARDDRSNLDDLREQYHQPNSKLSILDDQQIKMYEWEGEEGARVGSYVLLGPIDLVPLATTRNCHYS